MTRFAQTDWSSVQTPALTVDVVRLEDNIASGAQLALTAGVDLRPHIKTSKCLQVVARQRAAGAAGFTCSTPAEVAALTAAGFDELLWAHLPVGPSKVEAAVRYAESADVTTIVDSLAVARPVSDAAVRAGVEVSLLLDVDTGQGRTGVDPTVSGETARAIASLPGLRLVGIVTHEGHLGGFSDDRRALDDAGARAGELLVSVAESVRESGLDCAVVSVGSTPGMRSAPFVDGITEARPGTYVYYDANQVRLGSADWSQCALSVLTRVVSVNRRGSAIIDAGLKAMSSDALSRENGVGTIVDLDGVVLPDLTFHTANEEHGFLSGEGTSGLRVGDVLRVVPNHACGTTNMWSQLIAVHPTGASEIWPVVGRH